jgi:hypothetical protein
VKVTRLRRGYRIRLSDTEYAALDQLVAHGISEFQGVDPVSEYGISHRIARAMDGLSLIADEDRR